MGAAQTTAIEGNVSAEDLFRQHAPFVARFLFRLGVRSDAIEDALQEVFLVVHRQGGYRPGPAKPTSYLANLAVHAASAYRRRERARASREVDAGVEAIESAASTGNDPVRALEANESLRRLQAALDRLEPDLRTTLVLVELEGETCASVAAGMGIPVGTVYWRLHHARKRFQRVLQTMAPALGPHRALAVQAAGFAGGLKAERKERAGMMFLLMASPSWMGSTARELLRLGAARPPVSYSVEEGLLRHQQLAASGAPAPTWARGLAVAGKSAVWIAAATAAIVAGGGALLWTRAGPPAIAAPPPLPALAATTQADPAPTPPSSLAATPATPPPGSAIRVEDLPRAAPPLPAPAVGTRSAVSGDPSRSTSAAVGSSNLGDPPGLGDPSASTRRSDSRAATPAATTIAPATGDDLLELQEIARAERLLASDPGHALALARAAQTRFPDGYMSEERAYVEIMALVGLDRLEEARPRIDRFLREHPESAFTRRVREVSERVHAKP